MFVNCKTPTCDGQVDTSPQQVQISLFAVALNMNVNDLPDNLKFSDYNEAVFKIVKSTDIKFKEFNRFKTVFRTCSNTISPHTNAYQIPVK